MQKPTKSERVIGYSPFDGSNNEYTENMKRILSRFGRVVDAPTLRQLVHSEKGVQYDLVVSNWTDNAFIDQKTGRVTPKGVVRQFLWAFLCRMKSRQTVFVRHNIVPHSTSERSHGLVEKIVNLYERVFSAVWVHSGHLAGKERDYIPHPMYREVPQQGLPEELQHLGDKYYVIFGRIMPYKNIHALLEILPPGVRLAVCGPCADEDYLAFLRQLGGSNVVIYPKFLSEGAAQKLVREATALVLCSKEADMIASGSVMFALSLDTPVISMRSSFARWLSETFGNAMITDCSNVQEIADLLNRQQLLDTSGTSQMSRNFDDDHVMDAIQGSLKLTPLRPA